MKPKHFKEQFARFLERPNREGLREVLKNHLGESDDLDFKEAWSDKNSKIAKDILAFANTNSGCIVFGVKEQDDKTFAVDGLLILKDITKLKNDLKNYIPKEVEYDISDFYYEESEYTKLLGKKFQVLSVTYNPEIIPVLSKKSFQDSIKSNVAYIRYNISSTEANYEQLQSLIAKRIEYSINAKGRELKEHLSELEALYEKNGGVDATFSAKSMITGKSELYKFINRMISKKQEFIERMIEGKSE